MRTSNVAVSVTEHMQHDEYHVLSKKVKSCDSQLKGKGKAIPLQAWTGPEGSRRLRFPDFKTIST